MKAIQISLDETLAQEVDRAAHALGITRSAFTRDALRVALATLREKALEEEHRAGYARHPVKEGELSDW